MAGALRPIVQQRWATFVAERSRDLVDVVYLDAFLFGSARASLQRVKSPLLESQGGSCFYCGSRANASGTDVDHFIPWSRHPDNGLHNLVAAHIVCNNAKRDSLAGTEHLARWLDRFADRVSDQAARRYSWQTRRGGQFADAAHALAPLRRRLGDGYFEVDPAVRAFLVVMGDELA